MSETSRPDLPNVLIVDDIPANIHTLEVTLRPLNINLISASSGEEALSLLTRHSFILIVMDVQMPGMDGFETVRLLRSMSTMKNIPVIFVTAICTEASTVIEGYDSGAVDYLFKPIHPHILSSKVQVFITLYEQQQKMIELNSQLAQTQKMEAMGVLAAGVAHEFNNLFQPITGFSELMMRSDITPQQQEWLQSIHEMGLKGKLLVDNLMEYTRQRSHVRRVNIATLLTKYLDVLATVMPEDIQFDVDIAEHEDLVLADSMELWHVFEHLCQNSLQALENNPPEHKKILSLGLHQVTLDKPLSSVVVMTHELLPGRYSVLTLTDSGEGISDKDQPHIFEPFFSTKETGSGSGLGLSVVAGVVERMQGAIQLSSQEGEGATFRIYWPLTSVG
jgi:signal transduction histidine kinase